MARCQTSVFSIFRLTCLAFDYSQNQRCKPASQCVLLPPELFQPAAYTVSLVPHITSSSILADTPGLLCVAVWFADCFYVFL